MLENKLSHKKDDEQEPSFDHLMAHAFMLITQYGLTENNPIEENLTQHKKMLTLTIHKLDQLCQHSEIEFYPEQHLVLSKVRKLWEIKLFKLNHSQPYH